MTDLLCALHEVYLCSNQINRFYMSSIAEIMSGNLGFVLDRDA